MVCSKEKRVTMKKMALVVDDNADVRIILPALLGEYDYESEVTESPAVALTILDKRRFEAVFVDYEMPGMNGIQLIEFVRVRSPQSLVILMSGDTAAELFPSSKADAFLQKPFTLGSIRDAIDDATQRRWRAGQPQASTTG
jgi:DNA-binding NtrC family response regulator